MNSIILYLPRGEIKMAASEFNILQKSLEDARKNLSYTDGRIEKVTGRKPAEMRLVLYGISPYVQ